MITILSNDEIPTRLVESAERVAVLIRPVSRPTPFRVVFVMSTLIRLWVQIQWLRLTRRLSPAAYAIQVRETLKRLGPLWVQAGKFMAMRSDLVPQEFSHELAMLRDETPGFPFEEAKRIVENELGATLDSVFDQFEPQPFSSNSNFQLHQALLRHEQVWVAVKVQRPHSALVVAKDLAVIRRIANIFVWFKILPKMRWRDLYREVEEQVNRELDFRYEASALRQLATTLPDHNIYVPYLFQEYCSKRVLVMEYIRGVLLSDYMQVRKRDPERVVRWHEENNVDSRKVARRLLHSILRQIFEDNFFHADMHPCNIILLRNNRLAIIDCRSVGFLEAEHMRKQRMYYRCLSRAEFSTAAEHFFLLAYRLPVVDLGEVKAQLVRVWRRWESRNYVRDLPPKEKSITQMLMELNAIMHRYRFEIQWSMAKLAWTLVNADLSILPMAKSINYLKWMDSYFRQADRRANEIDPESLAENSIYAVNSLRDMPRMMLDSSVAQQEIIRRQAQVVQATTYKSSYFLSTVYEFMAVAFVLATLLTLGRFWIDLALDSGPARLERWIGPELRAVIESLPAIKSDFWLVLTIAFAYLAIYSFTLMRSSLRADSPTGSRQSGAD